VTSIHEISHMLGKKTIADSEGWAEIPVGRSGCSCSARSGELYGQARFNTNNVAPEGGYRVVAKRT